MTKNEPSKLKTLTDVKESEEIYRELFENAADPMYINSFDGYIMDINRAGIEKLGCSAKEEVIGTHVSRWFTPESLRLTQETLRKRISGEPADDPMIRQIVTKSGECRWAEIRSRLIKDGDRVVGFQGIARDITDKMELEQKVKDYQKQLEKSYEEVKKSEGKYRDLFENAQDVMYVVDTEGIVLKMNQVGLRILACPKEEVIGRNISKWLTPESIEIVDERRKKLCSGEMVDQTDILEVVCKNEEHRWVEIKIREIKGGEIHGIARDITESKRLKNELKESNKQLKLLWYLMEGTRGGKTRALILKKLIDRPYNANQLADVLNLDYKTVRHHLNILIKNGVITKDSDGYVDVYFLLKNMEANLNKFNREVKRHKNSLEVS